MAQHQPAIGSLVVTVVEARNLRDIHTVNKNDPYVEAHIEDANHKKKITHKESTNNPKWAESEGTLFFDVHKNDSILHVHVYDKKLLASDDELGHASVQFSNLESWFSSGSTDEWVTLHGSDKSLTHGEIRLKIQYVKGKSADEARLAWVGHQN